MPDARPSLALRVSIRKVGDVLGQGAAADELHGVEIDAALFAAAVDQSLAALLSSGAAGAANIDLRFTVTQDTTYTLSVSHGPRSGSCGPARTGPCRPRTRGKSDSRISSRASGPDLCFARN